MLPCPSLRFASSYRPHFEGIQAFQELDAWIMSGEGDSAVRKTIKTVEFDGDEKLD